MIVRSIRPATLLSALMLFAHPAGAQQFTADNLPTRAERTDYIETSSYADVMSFLRTLDEASDMAHLETMGYTMEGRAIPLLVLGNVPDGSPETVMNSGLLRVYLQGNIHGGEVPGKEALQMIARSIVSGDSPDWLDTMVLLITPIYNADGNERVQLTNRPRQHGPIGGMGQRPNSQDYDLNRDHMKLDSPEARSVVGMMNRYDPHVSVDLHTTNGTRHAYMITYSTPMHPGTDEGLIELLKGKALPLITDRVREADGEEFYYYGNASNRGGEMGWYTFDYRPRFNNNYIGLRNRIAILSEAYAYATFEARVQSTRRFVEEILTWASEDGPAIRAAIQAADASAVGAVLPLRAVPEGAPELTNILMGEVAEERHPITGQTILRRLDVVTPTPMREYGTFAGTDPEMVPAEYLIPASVAPAIDRMFAHGIEMEEVPAGTSAAGQVFVIDSMSVSARPFQGHNERTIFGSWQNRTVTLAEGGYRLRASQPLGRLAFYLLEPRADDGLANWALLDRFLENATEYPIYRVPAGR